MRWCPQEAETQSFSRSVKHGIGIGHSRLLTAGHAPARKHLAGRDFREPIRSPSDAGHHHVYRTGHTLPALSRARLL